MSAEQGIAGDQRIKVWFRFEPREGWLPHDIEGLWTTLLDEDTARIENVPFLQDGIAEGDVVATSSRWSRSPCLPRPSWASSSSSWSAVRRKAGGTSRSDAPRTPGELRRPPLERDRWRTSPRR
ncbi:DUF4265 domain-containing protein [Amycolatopsis sp.]|uniref:DUF4265 domain-containing protein n=1 Tax=Amycolatopsis sp. TaxID=37632 RepID=UPI00345837B7